MTIKRLNGGKLLCLMAAFAGAMTLGSCKDDDDEPEPTPAPDPVVKPVVKLPDVFTINDSISINGGEIITAKTLLEDGKNSSTTKIVAKLSNGVKVDANTISFSFSNDYIGTVGVEGTLSTLNDSTISIVFPSIEGDYSLKLNGVEKKFQIAGESALKLGSRSFSNLYTAKLDSMNKSLNGISFVSYSVSDDGAVFSKLSGNGLFYALTEEAYNKYVSGNRGLFEMEMKDIDATTLKNTFNTSNYFAYISNEKYYLGSIEFEGESLQMASSMKVSLTY